MPAPHTSTVSDEIGIRFFRRSDWIAAAVAAVVSLAVYVYTLAPEVTLEDSGEFVTASQNFGVPHPPGYPLWTLLTLLFTKIPFGNMAWRVNLFSAVCGAVTNGLIALLISRSGASFLDVVKPFSDTLTAVVRDRICQVAGITGGLVFAFSDVMWSQAVITEVYTLNTFFLVILMVLMFIWIHKPQDLRYLYWTAFWFGLGLTNHHTLVLIFPCFGLMVLLAHRAFLLDFLVSNLIILATVVGQIAYLSGDDQLISIAKRTAGVFTVVILAIVIYQRRFNWKPILCLVVALWAGLSFYFYMPLSSTTNPPMNWGYCRTKEGIYHHLTRGQYEAGLAEQIKRYLGPLVFVKPPPPPPSTGTPWSVRKYWGQINTFFDNLSDNFTLPVCLLALAGFFFFRDLASKDKWWLTFQLGLFFFLVPVLIKLLNPEFDKQTQQIQKVFYVLSHSVFAVWIGYGIAYLLAWLASATQSNQLVLAAGAVVALSLPLAPALTNYDDCEQRGHLFGYYFGHDMFETHPGLKPLYPSMDRDAVLYGGTDPGRFVPTYMIFCESRVPSKYKHPLDPNFDRRDVYIITQNALADDTYMNYIRDHYSHERPDLRNPTTLASRSPWQRWMFKFGWNWLDRDTTYPKESIWIPNKRKVEEGFQEYVRDIQKRGAQAGENVRIEGGKVQIQGVQGVMAINGIISKMIFEENKNKHSFYVEESYVIGWMYPYLEPFQIILKINKEPLPKLTPEMVKRDREFWDEYTSKLLLADPRFKRDIDAQKSFSKLRTAIGGVYAWRGSAGGQYGQPELNAEAEYAFRQALTMCPDSPETNFRFVELLTRQERFDDALDVLITFKKLDPYNVQIGKVEENVKNLKKNVEELGQWEERYKADPTNVDVCLRLIQFYGQRGRISDLDRVVDGMLKLPNVTSNQLVELARMYAQQNFQRLDRVAIVLDVLTKRYPEMGSAWYDLAAVNSILYRGDAALNALDEAIKRAGDKAGEVRARARQDQNLEHIRSLPRFKELVGE